MSGCPGEAVLTEYVRGDLDALACCRIDEHLDGCQACRERTSLFERRIWELLILPCCPNDPNVYLAENGASLAYERALAVVRSGSPVLSEQATDWQQLEAGDQIDDFLILRKLGSGGFAVVYLAHQKSMPRLVALKISNQRSFEAPALCNLDHPHIVRVFDQKSLMERGLHLLYMQYVPGGSLKQALKRLRPIEPNHRRGNDLRAAIATHMQDHGESGTVTAEGMPTDSDWTSAVCWLGARVADALRHAHQRGRQHRDVKPANILLTADGRPLLADFNLSSGVAINGLRSDDVCGGSVEYMSPEQLKVYLGLGASRDIGPPSDIYSLGLVLWELLVGERPFPSPSEVVPSPDELRALWEARCRGIGERPLPTSVPTGLQEVVRALLNPEAAARPTPGELARTLELHAAPAVRNLLSPAATSWTVWCRRWPITCLLVCGLLPNLTVAIINIGCNYNYLGIDRDELRRLLVPMNLMVFSVGVGVPLWFARPLRQHLSKHDNHFRCDSVDCHKAAHCCLLLPSVVHRVSLGLWVLTGILFPALIDWNSPAKVAWRGFAEFFTSQLIHGLIASSIAFLAVMLGAMRFCFAQLVRLSPYPELRPQVDQLRKRIDWHAALLALVPSCALMVVVLLRQEAKVQNQDSMLFALGLFGATSITVVLTIAPAIRRTLAILRRTLIPTDQLFYGDVDIAAEQGDSGRSTPVSAGKPPS